MEGSEVYLGGGEKLLLSGKDAFVVENAGQVFGVAKAGGSISGPEVAPWGSIEYGDVRLRWLYLPISPKIIWTITKP